MRRRTLLRMGLASVTTAVVAPRIVLANESPLNPFTSQLAGTLFYMLEKTGPLGRQRSRTRAADRAGRQYIDGCDRP